MEKTAVTALCWVPRGKLNVKGPEAEDDPESLREAHDAAEAIRGGSSVAQAQAVASEVTRGLEEFDLDNYDADEDNQDGMQFFSVLKGDGALLREKDPNMSGDPDSESEDEPDDIKPDDQVFMAVSCEEDSCQLEVYVFDEEEANMYVHHDVMLSAYPLCVEWLSTAGAGLEGSFGAVGLIDHTIQIWDIEDMDPVEPTRCLGSAKKGAKGKKKRANTSTLQGARAHDGPVLCLHSSVFNNSVLASGSADETLKIWDVNENTCVHTYAHHGDKVQTVRWHPTEQAVLLSAGFDKRLALLDVRQPNQAAMADLSAEAESAIWSRHSPFQCLASVDNGGVVCYDVRKVVSKAEGARLWTLMAHDVACTAISDAPTKDLLVTVGLDGQAKVWNTANQPSLSMSKDLKAGPLFACEASPDAPALMCFGGKLPVMWDLTSEQLLVDAYGFPSEGSAAA